MTYYLQPNTTTQEYLNVISDTLNLGTCLSSSVLSSKTIHHDFRNLLIRIGPNCTFKDTPRNLSVRFKITNAFWRKNTMNYYPSGKKSRNNLKKALQKPSIKNNKFKHYQFYSTRHTN